MRSLLRYKPKSSRSKTAMRPKRRLRSCCRLRPITWRALRGTRRSMGRRKSKWRHERKSKQHVIVPGAGDPCPRCGLPTQIREHDALTAKHLERQPFYYSRWFYCGRSECKAKQIMPDRFRVYRDEATRLRFEE